MIKNFSRPCFVDPILAHVHEAIRSGRLAGKFPGALTLAAECKVSHGRLRAALINPHFPALCQGFYRPAGVSGASRQKQIPAISLLANQDALPSASPAAQQKQHAESAEQC